MLRLEATTDSNPTLTGVTRASRKRRSRKRAFSRKFNPFATIIAGLLTHNDKKINQITKIDTTNSTLTSTMNCKNIVINFYNIFTEKKDKIGKYIVKYGD